jgi:hypothetical protein
VRSIHHAQAYIGGLPPALLDGENLTRTPIRLEIENNHLHRASRINIGKIYTVEHNTEVYGIGKVTNEHVPLLHGYFHEIHGPFQEIPDPFQEIPGPFQEIPGPLEETHGPN